MEQILKIINDLQSTSSRIEKEAILKTNEDNELLKKIFKFVYDPYIVTGLSSKKIKKKIKLLPTGTINSIEECLQYLKQNNTGKDEDIATIQLFVGSCPQEQRDLIIQIVTKSLKIGATANTLNKVYGEDFIPSFAVMLADKYFKNEEKVTGEFIVTQKLDGVRGVVVKENNSIKIFSRQGQLVEGLVEIEEEAKMLSDNTVYDGEMILNDDGSMASKDLYRETVKVVRKDGEKRNVIFNCFDALPIEDFKKGISKISCSERKNFINDQFINEPERFSHIIEVPILYQGLDKSKIIELLDEQVALEHEGVMVNIADAPYSCKRTKDILKVKKMQDCDLRVVSIEEGEGRLKGTLGKINVNYKENIVGVGSGFSDEMRKEVFENREKYISKIAKVQYFEETTNSKDDKVSLRFPVFLEWRFDKTEPSYF